MARSHFALEQYEQANDAYQAASKAGYDSDVCALAQAEALVAELESKLHAIDMDLADPDVYADGATNASEFSRRRDALAAERATAEEALLAIYEAA